jgi:capsular polysaccharide biosynthesis protein
MSLTYTLRWLRRRGIIVALATILVCLAAAFAFSTHATRYESSANLYVPTGSKAATANTAPDPGSTNDAIALATTYTKLIPQDSAVIDTAANDLNISRDTTRNDLSVTTVGPTNLMKLSFTADTPARAVKGLSDIIQALLSGESSTVTEGTLQQVSAPQSDDIVTHKGVGTSTRALIGLIIGLILGAIIAMAWGRHDRRIDTAEELQRLVPSPVTYLNSLTPWNVRALYHRWAERAGADGATVAIVTPASRAGDPVRMLERGLADGQVSASFEVTRWRDDILTRDTPEGGRVILAGQVGSEDGIAGVLCADLVVFAVTAGTAERDVVRALELLRQHDVVVAWSLVVNRGLARSDRLAIGSPRSSASAIAPAPATPERARRARTPHTVEPIPGKSSDAGPDGVRGGGAAESAGVTNGAPLELLSQTTASHRSGEERSDSRRRRA